MVSKDDLLEMLDDAVRQEEAVIAGWRDAVVEKLPASELTNEQKAQLKKIVDIQMSQSFMHKKIFTDWVKKLVSSDEGYEY